MSKSHFTCLALEGTAHTAAVAVVNSTKHIFFDERDMLQSEKGGIIPHEAAKHHSEVFDRLIQKALLEISAQGITLDCIAVSRSPGLAPCLKVTFEKAKALAQELHLPLVGVNHCIAHLTSAHLFTDVIDPVYVFVSGANTQIIALEGKRFRIFGETLDTGIGNALDKFGRSLGLGFP